jgi:hypothetical protein
MMNNSAVSGISDLLGMLTPPESPDLSHMSAHVSVYSPGLQESLPACLADLVEFREDDNSDRRQRPRLEPPSNCVLNMAISEEHQEDFDEFADAVGESIIVSPFFNNINP